MTSLQSIFVVEYVFSEFNTMFLVQANMNLAGASPLQAAA
jgi:hypothetical protein